VEVDAFPLPALLRPALHWSWSDGQYEADDNRKYYAFSIDRFENDHQASKKQDFDLNLP
jgi:hypothetical protein